MPVALETEAMQVRFDIERGISQVRSGGEWPDRLDHGSSTDASGTKVTEVKCETTDDS